MNQREWNEVRKLPNAKNYFLSAYKKRNSITIIRGDFSTLKVPCKWFTPSGSEQMGNLLKPNFYDIEVTDYGQTLRLGRYEAANHAILLEFDEEYKIKYHIVKVINFIKSKLDSIESLPVSVDKLTPNEYSIFMQLTNMIGTCNYTVEKLEELRNIQQMKSILEESNDE